MLKMKGQVASPTVLLSGPVKSGSQRRNSVTRDTRIQEDSEDGSDDGKDTFFMSSYLPGFIVKLRISDNSSSHYSVHKLALISSPPILAH